MYVSAELIAELRRKVAEPTSRCYSDDDLAAWIKRFPLRDADGYEPQIQGATGWITNPAWTPRYDLNRAAARIWQEKAAPQTVNYDYSADGVSLQRSQAYEQAMKQARYFNARRAMSGLWQVREEQP